jgi:hypothetical protein
MDTARAHVEQALASACMHPRYRKLQSELVLREAQDFVAGQPIDQLLHLQQLLGELCFTCTADWSIEGDHAQA